MIRAAHSAGFLAMCLGPPAYITALIVAGERAWLRCIDSIPPDQLGHLPSFFIAWWDFVLLSLRVPILAICIFPPFLALAFAWVRHPRTFPFLCWFGLAAFALWLFSAPDSHHSCDSSGVDQFVALFLLPPLAMPALLLSLYFGGKHDQPS